MTWALRASGRGTLAWSTRISVLATLVSAVVPGCRETRPRNSERVVVELVSADAKRSKKHEVITEAEYRRELARVRVAREGTLNAPPLSLELKQAIIDTLVDRRLVMMEAVEKGVRASTVAVAEEVAAMRRTLPPHDFERLLIQTYQTEDELAGTIEQILTASLLIKAEAGAETKVTDEDVRQAYEKLSETEKLRPARVRASQILVQTEEEGRAVVQALKKGQDFDAVARARSIGPESVRGGDLGWFEAGVMPSVFDEVCFALEPGQVSELTASDTGYHVFKVTAKEPERSRSFEDARPELIERLREERERRAEQKFIETLRQRVKIVKNEELIASIE